jgi:signal transduction histidine kinase
LSLFARINIVAASAALILGLAVLELSAEPSLRLSLLYLVPVALVTWTVSRRAGFAFAIAAGAVTLLSGLVYDRFPPAIAVWNCGMRVGVLTTMVWLLAAVRANARKQDQAVRERASELQREIAQRKQAEREFFRLLQTQREQIAYDLHDDLAQVLTAISMKTKLLESELRESFSPQAERTAAIVKLMNAAVGQTRTIAHGLCPIDAESAELVSAIRRLADETSKSFGVKCHSTSSHSALAYNRDAAVHIYRIAQQAIDNAIRHGKASCIEIKLTHTDQQFQMTVHDDGIGFTAGEAKPQGLGLRTMAFRADVFNGTFQITSAPGKGTCVEVTADVAALLDSEPALHQHVGHGDSHAHL